jgi:hypothetical protein
MGIDEMTDFADTLRVNYLHKVKEIVEIQHPAPATNVARADEVIE